MITGYNMYKLHIIFVQNYDIFANIYKEKKMKRLKR